MTGIPQVSIFWLLYCIVAGYLIGWTARHHDPNHQNNWWAVKIIWALMGIVGIFVLGYTVAGIVLLYK